MRILFVYPKLAEALWAYKHALSYIRKQASSPPLGLLTVAAMLPAAWEKKLVDLNVTSLSDDDLKSADYVFISAMLAQQSSTNQVIARCKSLGIPTVAGGPLFTFAAEKLKVLEPDHKFCGEAEGLIEIFLNDLQASNPRPVYKDQSFPELQRSPIPLWELVENLDAYTMMTLQFTRGCPYDCEFCDVVALNGHKPRMKAISQILQEMEALYQAEWRGHVFICDDNFVGNRKVIRESVLPAMIAWMSAHSYPFSLSSAVSIDLANHPDIMDMMVAAGFDRVTVGIESPNIQSLRETNKLHNLRQNLLGAVRTIQQHGLEVQAGFIVGFDHDTPSIFTKQIEFIQSSGIATAMVSMLFAFPGTRLYARLQRENRLLPITVNAHAYGSINFEPKMGIAQLRGGHLEILEMIYAPQPYYQRLLNFLSNYRRPATHTLPIRPNQLWLLPKIIWDLGFADQGRWYFWKAIWRGCRYRIWALPTIIRLMVTGYNFRKDIDVYKEAIAIKSR